MIGRYGQYSGCGAGCPCPSCQSQAAPRLSYGMPGMALLTAHPAYGALAPYVGPGASSLRSPLRVYQGPLGKVSASAKCTKWTEELKRRKERDKTGDFLQMTIGKITHPTNSAEKKKNKYCAEAEAQAESAAMAEEALAALAPPPTEAGMDLGPLLLVGGAGAALLLTLAFVVRR